MATAERFWVGKRIGEIGACSTRSPRSVKSYLTSLFTLMFCSSIRTASDVRPVIQIEVDDIKVRALFDTGANVSAISKRCFLRKTIRPKLDPSNWTLTMADGTTKLKVLGQTEVTLDLGTKKVRHTVQVVDGLHNDCIVGAELLAEHDILIDCKRKRIKVQSVTVANPSTCVAIHSAKTSLGSLNRTMTFMPHNESLVKCNTSLPPGSIVESTARRVELAGLVLLPVVGTVGEDGAVHVVLMNPTNGHLKLDRDTNIIDCAEVQERELREINSITKFRQEKKKTEIKREDMNLTGIPEEWRNKYEELLKLYSDIFSVNPNDVGRCSTLKQDIKLIDESKIACTPPYRLPHHLQHIAEEYVQKLLEADIIRPSNSPFSSPLLLVKKPNCGKKDVPLIEMYRVVHDFRRLNVNTIKDSYPMYNMYHLIDEVSQGKVWSVIDLSSGFWNQELTEKSKPYTSFGVMGVGSFEYNRSAQGLANSSASFQRLLDHITKGLRHTFVYTDDVILSSQSHEQHLTQLKALFDRFREFNLKCRLSKLQLGTKEINYLGYNLSHAKGLRAGEAKTMAVKDWKPPQDTKEIRQFLGLASFFRRTIKDFASLASPLTKLTRQTSDWKKGILPTEAMSAFRSIQKKLCERPCLKPVNFDQEFILTVDASTKIGLGAILSQIDVRTGLEHPCAYASRVLSDSEQGWSSFHVEHLAMLWACRHFKPYLLGKHFLLRTDHQPLVSLNKVTGQQMDRIKAELEDFSFTVEYIPGDKMPADGLSRQIAAYDSETPLPFMSWDQLYDIQTQDAHCKSLTCYLKYDAWPENRSYRDFINSAKGVAVLRQGVLCHHEKSSVGDVAIAPSTLRVSIMQAAHDQAAAGHIEYTKTLARIKQHWWWPTMHLDVKTHCRGCHVCATVNLPHKLTRMPLLKMEEANRFNDRVHCDLLGPMSPSGDMNAKYIFCLVDAYSSYSVLVPLPSKQMSETAKAFMENWVYVFGCPLQLTSDLGSEFKNQMFIELSEKLKFKHVFSSIGHAMSNGAVEIKNRSIIGYMRKYLDGGNDWYDLLPSLQFSLNAAPHSSTGLSPHFMAFGRRPRLPFELVTPDSVRKTYGEDEVSNQLRVLADTNHKVLGLLDEAFRIQKREFDKRASGSMYKPGDRVYINRPKTPGQIQKFQPLFKGPYIIQSDDGNFNFTLQPETGRRKCVRVHANRIKPVPFIQQLYDVDIPDSQAYLPKPTTRGPSVTNPPPQGGEDDVDDDDDSQAETDEIGPAEDDGILLIRRHLEGIRE